MSPRRTPGQREGSRRPSFQTTTESCSRPIRHRSHRGLQGNIDRGCGSTMPVCLQTTPHYQRERFSCSHRNATPRRMRSCGAGNTNPFYCRSNRLASCQNQPCNRSIHSPHSGSKTSASSKSTQLASRSLPLRNRSCWGALRSCRNRDPHSSNTTPSGHATIPIATSRSPRRNRTLERPSSCSPGRHGHSTMISCPLPTKLCFLHHNRREPLWSNHNLCLSTGSTTLFRWGSTL